MRNNASISGYRYDSAAHGHSHAYLLQPLEAGLDAIRKNDQDRTWRLFELGCGNGSVANYLSRKGWEVVGVDPSSDGIAQANKAYPHLCLKCGSASDDLVATYGRFPVVISLEVVEHVYAPREYARTLFDLLEPGGTVIISTPYHGYLKNLALALTGKMDAHFTALWDYGHIKFWSIRTLRRLLEEACFVDVAFRRVGRIPPLAKSMIAVARKP